ncbi:MAG: hypothetical protein LBU22_13030 [Dysgonamonadaceae bacterium]|jgi:hypothetical protein|nr:hypothetical protein [Dysgonamonadaceae bacterium]
MEQKDYLTRQAEIFGQVLGKILANSLHLKNQEQTSNSIAITIRTFSEDLGLDIMALIATEPDDLIKMLLTEKKFSSGNLEQFADILFIMAENMSQKEKDQLNKKCLAIYEYIEVADTTYSFNRQWKIEKIKTDLLPVW